MLNSKIYTGKEGDEVQRDLGREAVMSVMEPYLDKGYYVFMHNYYTSFALYEELEERSTLACGTVRSNRLGLSKEICGPKEKKVKEPKREKVCIHSMCDMRDQKPVSVLATIPTSEADESVVQRYVKVK